MQRRTTRGTTIALSVAAMLLGGLYAAQAADEITGSGEQRPSGEIKQQVDPNYPPAVPSRSERESNPEDPRATDNQMGFGRHALPPDASEAPGYEGADQDSGRGQNMGGSELTR